MVGRMLLLKMLHCKRTKGRKIKTADESASGESGTTQKTPERMTVKKEFNDGLCRVCLTKGCIPIFGNNKQFEDVSESLCTFGGIKVTMDDPYPKFLCEDCNGFLQGAILLRKNAQQSAEILKCFVKDIDPHKNESLDYYEDNSSSESEESSEHKKGRSHKDESLDYYDEDSNSSDYEKSKPTKPCKGYHCKKCEISFDTFKEYNEHRLSEEHENMRLVCPVCNKSYTALYLKKHLTLHKQEAPYMCDICGKNFIFQGQFSRHRLTHFYELPFNCSLCPYKGRFKESLKMHMRSHTGEKPYQCAQCPSRFVSKSNLNKHMMIHKTERDFKCNLCDRGFNYKRTLDLHYKVDHTGVKDHVCNICGKAFGYRKQMMKHQLKVHKRAKLRSGRMPLYLKVETMKEQGQNISVES